MHYHKLVPGFLLLCAALLLLCATAFAATWECPAGAYTPTNHSVNITKYQIDSAAHHTMSSAKVDGDINKAFQGLNDIEARTPPSVSGKTGLFLSNDGTSAFWQAVTPTSIILQMPSIFSVTGSPISSTGTASVTLATQSSNTFLAGPASGSNAAPTFRQITLNDLSAIVSNSVISATVSTSNVTTTNIAATNGIALRGFTQATDTSISAGASVNLTHGCGATPRFAWAELVNQSAELGYTAGMTAQIPTYAGQGANISYAIGSDATSTTLKIGSAGSLAIINLGSGASSGITNGNWKIRLKVGC